MARREKAVELDPGDAYAHVILGLRYGYDDDFMRNLAEFNRALEINPNHADALSVIGGNLPWLETSGRAVDLVERAVRLNPHHPDWYNVWTRNAHFFAGDFEKAVAIMRSSNAAADAKWLDGLAQLGQMEAASKAATELLRDDPDMSQERDISHSGDLRRRRRPTERSSSTACARPGCRSVPRPSSWPNTRT